MQGSEIRELAGQFFETSQQHLDQRGLTAKGATFRRESDPTWAKVEQAFGVIKNLWGCSRVHWRITPGRWTRHRHWPPLHGSQGIGGMPIGHSVSDKHQESLSESQTGQKASPLVQIGFLKFIIGPEGPILRGSRLGFWNFQRFLS